MSKTDIIAVQVDENTTIFIEASNNDVVHNGSIFTQASSNAGGKVIQKAKEYFENQVTQIRIFASSISQKLESIDNKPDEIELEFGIKFGAEAGVIISSASSEANITLKLKWSK